MPYKKTIKKKLPYVGPKGKKELNKIYGHSLKAKQPMPSLQEQNDMGVNYMNKKIKGYCFDLK